MTADRQQLIDTITDRVVERLNAAECGCQVAPAEEHHLRAMVENGACRLACGEKARTLPRDLAATIDHTQLKPDADEATIRELCAEAKEFGFASVCVQPTWVALCAELLRGSAVEVCTVIGFPHGANLSDTKAFEARRAVEQGATEVDMVINVGQLKSRNYSYVFHDIEGVVQATGGRACTKVILETTLLTDDEKAAACALAKEACADYVKTSTGFAGGGATVDDVALMRRVVGSTLGVKASGGVRDRETAQAMIDAGANRLGASAGVKIVQGGQGSAGY